MKTILKIITLVAALALLAGPAAASTVLYSQPPDLSASGEHPWDVLWAPGYTLADDWWLDPQLVPVPALITDVHFWYSWQMDDPEIISNVTLSIWSDVPAAGEDPSHPGQRLWYSEVGPPFNLSLIDTGAPYYRGSYSPATGDYNPNDHSQVYRADFYIDPEDAFLAVPGQIYWLGIALTVESGISPGWSTSETHFTDDAAWALTSEGIWTDLHDPDPYSPSYGESLDFAFEVTGQMVPAPPALLLLGPGLMLVWGYRRRRS